MAIEPGRWGRRCRPGQRTWQWTVEMYYESETDELSEPEGHIVFSIYFVQSRAEVSRVGLQHSMHYERCFYIVLWSIDDQTPSLSACPAVWTIRISRLCYTSPLFTASFLESMSTLRFQTEDTGCPFLFKSTAPLSRISGSILIKRVAPCSVVPSPSFRLHHRTFKSSAPTTSFYVHQNEQEPQVAPTAGYIR